MKHTTTSHSQNMMAICQQASPDICAKNVRKQLSINDQQKILTPRIEKAQQLHPYMSLHNMSSFQKIPQREILYPMVLEPVYLNVYNISEANSVLKYFGLGFYHTAVEVYEKEYWYGGSEYGRTGVVVNRPLQLVAQRGKPNSMNVTFKERIFIGITKLNRKEVGDMKHILDQRWIGNEYDPFDHNCNDFSKEMIHRLVGFEFFPKYINRFSGIKLFLIVWFPPLKKLFGDKIKIADQSANLPEKFRRNIRNHIKSASLPPLKKLTPKQIERIPQVISTGNYLLSPQSQPKNTTNSQDNMLQKDVSKFKKPLPSSPIPPKRLSSNNSVPSPDNSPKLSKQYEFPKSMVQPTSPKMHTLPNEISSLSEEVKKNPKEQRSFESSKTVVKDTFPAFSVHPTQTLSPAVGGAMNSSTMGILDGASFASNIVNNKNNDLSYFSGLEMILQTKQEGDRFFSNGLFEDANEKYKECLTILGMLDDWGSFLNKMHKHELVKAVVMNIASTYERMHNYGGVIKYCSKAIQCENKFIKAYLWRAIAYAKMKLKDLAQADLDMALSLSPNDNEVLFEVNTLKKHELFQNSNYLSKKGGINFKCQRKSST